MQPNQNTPLDGQSEPVAPFDPQQQQPQQPMGPPAPPMNGELPPVGPPAAPQQPMQPPAAPMPQQPFAAPDQSQPMAPQQPMQQPMGVPGNPPMPSQQTYPSSGGMKKMILIIIGGLITVSILGVIAVVLLSGDDPTSSTSSNSGSESQSETTTTTLETTVEEGLNYSLNVPSDWSQRSDELGTVTYTDQPTDAESSATLIYRTESVITIPGFTSFTETDKLDFADGFIQGFESSFVDSAEDAGGLIRTVSTRVVNVEGSELTFEFDYSGVNVVGNDIQGKGRYLTNSRGDMYSVLITALADQWNSQQAEYAGLINSYRVK